MTEELAFARIYDPANALFKEHRNDKAKVTRYWCKNSDCPLRAKGQCTYAPILGWDRCPYGRVTFEEGFTWRARKYHAWLTEQKEKLKGIKAPGNPDQRIAFIGDYVYLPYPHMNMMGEPFLAKESLFVKGNAFMPRSAWTLEFVLKALAFRPQALMGGEIRSYREESVPLFLRHLREEDPEMWAALIAVRPDLDKPPVYVGRKALLYTLRPGISFGPYHAAYPVRWTWDGEYLYTSDRSR